MIYRKTFLISVFVLYVQTLCAQHAITGYWEGQMVREQAAMNVSIDIRETDKELRAHFSSAIQKASGIPLTAIAYRPDSISFQLMSQPTSYFTCAVNADEINGTFRQEGFPDGKIFLKRTAAKIKKYTFRDTSFAVNKRRIACRIYFPKAAGQHPAIVFMHGSGAEPMFANQYYAEYLASKGIVTLISDKQGVGRSTGNWQTASFDTLANDHIAAVDFLKSFKAVNPGQIGIYGHSQGGTIAPLVASRSKSVSFIIAAAAVGDSVYKQDLYRVEKGLRKNGFSGAALDSAMTYYRSWLDMARTGRGFERLAALTGEAGTHAWFDWVQAPPVGHWIYSYYQKTGNFNCLAYWRRVTVPTLLVYGQYDQIEDVDAYSKNITDALSGRNIDLTTVILPRAQHNLVVEPAETEPFFWGHSAHGYEDLLAGWILYRYK